MKSSNSHSTVTASKTINDDQYFQYSSDVNNYILNYQKEIRMLKFISTNNDMLNESE